MWTNCSNFPTVENCYFRIFRWNTVHFTQINESILNMMSGNPTTIQTAEMRLMHFCSRSKLATAFWNFMIIGGENRFVIKNNPTVISNLWNMRTITQFTHIFRLYRISCKYQLDSDRSFTVDLHAHVRLFTKHNSCECTWFWLHTHFVQPSMPMKFRWRHIHFHF